MGGDYPAAKSRASQPAERSIFQDVPDKPGARSPYKDQSPSGANRIAVSAQAWRRLRSPKWTGSSSCRWPVLSLRRSCFPHSVSSPWPRASPPRPTARSRRRRDENLSRHAALTATRAQRSALDRWPALQARRYAREPGRQDVLTRDVRSSADRGGAGLYACSFALSRARRLGFPATTRLTAQIS